MAIIKLGNLATLSDPSHESGKPGFHRTARTFLKSVADALEMLPKDFDLRSNKAGPAVAGEITLHADHIYIQVSDSCTGPGVEILYRDCKSRKDYTGGQNRFMRLDRLTESKQQESWIQHLKTLIKTTQAQLYTAQQLRDGVETTPGVFTVVLPRQNLPQLLSNSTNGVELPSMAAYARGKLR